MTPTLTPTNIQEHIGNVKIILEQATDLFHNNIEKKVYIRLIWNISYADCLSATYFKHI